MGLCSEIGLWILNRRQTGNGAGSLLQHLFATDNEVFNYNKYAVENKGQNQDQFQEMKVHRTCGPVHWCVVESQVKCMVETGIMGEWTGK